MKPDPASVKAAAEIAETVLSRKHYQFPQLRDDVALALHSARVEGAAEAFEQTAEIARTAHWSGIGNAGKNIASLINAASPDPNYRQSLLATERERLREAVENLTIEVERDDILNANGNGMVKLADVLRLLTEEKMDKNNDA